VIEVYQDIMDLRVGMEFQESRVYLETLVCLVHLDSKEREAMKENLEYLADQVKIDVFIFTCTSTSMQHVEVYF
jgi:maleate cis-trans isomerase